MGIKYVLYTSEGDVWRYDTLEDARMTQYIFGGQIKEEDSDDKCDTE